MVYFSNCNFQAHESEAHVTEPDQSEPAAAEKPLDPVEASISKPLDVFSCDVCEKSFKRRFALKEHMR